MGVLYEGFFVQDSMHGSLEKDIEFKHITTQFKPAQGHEELYGASATFGIVGYGNDGKNEGYKVKLLSCDNEELAKLFDDIAVPHITLSVSSEGKPVDTGKLQFDECENAMVIHTVFGGFKGKPVTQAKDVAKSESAKMPTVKGSVKPDDRKEGLLDSNLLQSSVQGPSSDRDITA